MMNMNNPHTPLKDQLMALHEGIIKTPAVPSLRPELRNLAASVEVYCSYLNLLYVPPSSARAIASPPRVEFAQVPMNGTMSGPTLPRSVVVANGDVITTTGVLRLRRPDTNQEPLVPEFTNIEPTVRGDSLFYPIEVLRACAPPPTDHIVAGRYRQERKIGGGSFGNIYLGVEISGNRDEVHEVAIKREPVDTKHPQLAYEAKLYKHFQPKSWPKALRGSQLCVPVVRWFGRDHNDHVLIMDLQGPSLEDLFTFCSRKFSLKTTLMLAEQCLHRIEYVHRRGYVHRDIKPDNFLIGTGRRENCVYLIDFGLAKRYKDAKTGQHIAYSEQKSLTGTARYASVHTHLGREQSRRDDLESLGFVLMYFCRGHLPWQGLKATTKREKYDRISDKKMSISIDALCKYFPEEFNHYFVYVRSLAFDEEPDYKHLRSLFRSLFVRMGYSYDLVYDWTIYTGVQLNMLKNPISKLSHVSRYNTDLTRATRHFLMQIHSLEAECDSTYCSMPAIHTVLSSLGFPFEDFQVEQASLGFEAQQAKTAAAGGVGRSAASASYPKSANDILPNIADIPPKFHLRSSKNQTQGEAITVSAREKQSLLVQCKHKSIKYEEHLQNMESNAANAAVNDPSKDGRNSRNSRSRPQGQGQVPTQGQGQTMGGVNTNANPTAVNNTTTNNNTMHPNTMNTQNMMNAQNQQGQNPRYGEMTSNPAGMPTQGQDGMLQNHGGHNQSSQAPGGQVSKQQTQV